MSLVKNTDGHSIIQDLRESICDDDVILIQAESFSIFAFDQLKERIEKAKEIKILITDENIKDFFDEDFDIPASKRLESANIALQIIERIGVLCACLVVVVLSHILGVAEIYKLVVHRRTYQTDAIVEVLALHGLETQV